MRFFATALLGVLLSARAAHAEDVQLQNAALADLGLHVVGLGYQRVLSPRIAVQLDADSYTPWTQTLNVFGFSGDAYKPGKLTGVVIRQRVFFYPFAKAPCGFWLSPFAQYGLAWATRDGESRIGSVGAVGASVGYAFFIGRHVLVGLGAGAQYHAARIFGGDGPPSFGTFYPTLDANLGYAF